MAASRSERRDHMEAALLHGVDLDGRRIFLHDSVSEESTGLAIRGLYLAERLDAKTPVELFVTSYGGSLDDAFALHDVTRTIKCPVHTVALGKCMSAAPLLVACGHAGHRWATPSTTFMLHDTHIEIDGSPRLVEGWARNARGLMERYADLLERYTHMDRGFWLRTFGRKEDRIFDAEQALDWGLVDHIWEEKS